MPVQDDYQITLEAFCGPLDLLLYLIRRAEVDIHDIAIAEITDQYLAFLRQIDDVDIDQAGEFLVMAATLIEIKSRSLAPVAELQSPTGDGEGEGEGGVAAELTDPRQDLIRQLLAYQRYRLASERLEHRRQDFARRYPRRPPRNQGPDEHAVVEIELELEDVHILDLAEAYERIMGSIDFSRLGDHRVEMDDTPLALHQEDLLDRLQRSIEGRLTLQDAFEGHNRPQRIGLFLATLELVRQRRVEVCQPDIDSPIELALLDEDDALFVEPEVELAASPDSALPDEPPEPAVGS
ncbi:MAG: segregation and condensation protein A [Planctomycetota bacterium]|jgi:segregation and condensation protein A